MRAGGQTAGFFLSLNGWCMVEVYLLSIPSINGRSINPGSGHANCALPSLLFFGQTVLCVLEACIDVRTGNMLARGRTAGELTDNCR